MSQFHPDYSAEIVINNIDDSDDSDNNSSSSNLTEKLKIPQISISVIKGNIIPLMMINVHNILNSNLQKDALIKKNREKLNKPVTVFVTNENGNISGLMNGDFSSTSSTNLSSIKEVSSSDSFGKKELPIMPKPLSLNNSSEAIDENFVKSHIVSIDETLENCQSEFSESNNPKNKFDDKPELYNIRTTISTGLPPSRIPSPERDDTFSQATSTPSSGHSDNQLIPSVNNNIESPSLIRKHTFGSKLMNIEETTNDTRKPIMSRYDKDVTLAVASFISTLKKYIPDTFYLFIKLASDDKIRRSCGRFLLSALPKLVSIMEEIEYLDDCLKNLLIIIQKKNQEKSNTNSKSYSKKRPANGSMDLEILEAAHNRNEGDMMSLDHSPEKVEYYNDYYVPHENNITENDLLFSKLCLLDLYVILEKSSSLLSEV